MQKLFEILVSGKNLFDGITLKLPNKVFKTDTYFKVDFIDIQLTARGSLLDRFMVVAKVLIAYHRFQYHT